VSRHPGLWPSPWPAEDGGPRREQAPSGISGLGLGLGLAAGGRLRLAARRDAFATTMVVLREPGEVFVLRHSLGRRPHRDPAVSWVERINPLTLETVARSAELPGGPFWPGGLLAHANGSLHVVFGRWCHRLSPGLEVLASRRLPRPRPYNSCVVLADGTLAMKDLDRSLRTSASLTLLDPDTLAPRCDEVVLREPSVGRLAADGNTVFVVGTRTVGRLSWDGARCSVDADWRLAYHGGRDHSYGWDPVISGGQLWFLDNGAHRYATTMRGAGVARGPVRLIRVSLVDCADHEYVAVCGSRRGTVTDPPVYDPERRIAVAYDSGNGIVQAFRFDGRVTPLWQHAFDHAAHMLLFRDTGEVVIHDFHGPAFARTRIAQALGDRSAAPARSSLIRHALARVAGDDVVVLDIETGTERARTRVPSMFQSVLFPAPGLHRDLYWCTFSTLARLEVT
jgi:hypothetical protein